MLILAADTTTPVESVALLRGSRLLDEVNSESGTDHSQRLLPAVRFLLHSRGLDIRDVEGYALAAGPGSFTGIRIGLSTFKSLGYASGRQIAPVSTLEAMAFKLREPGTRLVCPLLDAKKMEVYGALFEVRGGSLREVVPAGAYSPDRLFSLLPGRRVIHFVGGGAEMYRQKINDYFKDQARFPSRSPFIAHEVGLLGYEMFRAGRGLGFLEVEPLYLRRSQAEEAH